MTCRACRSDRLTEVFKMDPMPLAGAFAASADEAKAMTRYPLTWLLCHDCGLVNVSPDIPDDLIYRTYSYAASTVPALVRHHAEFARILTERYGTDPIRLLEVGGNDGVLLRQLPDTWDLWNIDPSDVAMDHFDDSVYGLYPRRMTATVGELGTYDVVTSSNAFAHFSDIAGALDGVARILKPGGEFWVEVHDLRATLRTGQWDTIYHEHKVEWEINSLRRAICPRGLRFVDFWSLPLHGGLVRALFVKDKPCCTTPVVHWPEDFGSLQRSYDERRAPALSTHSAAYGAAARATVYLNQMWPLPIDYIVDASPLRAGKFVPGVGIPVLAPETFEQDRPETTLITAWNHAADIRARHPGYEGWVSAW